jgi:hypothetical protein
MTGGIPIKLHAWGQVRLGDLSWLAYGWAALAASMGVTQMVGERMTRPVYLFADSGDGASMTGEYTLLLSALVVAFGQGLGYLTKFLRERQQIASEGAAGQVVLLQAEVRELRDRVIDRDRELVALDERLASRDREIAAIGEHNLLLIDRNKRLWTMLVERANLILGSRNGEPPTPAIVVDKLAVIPPPDPRDDEPAQVP